MQIGLISDTHGFLDPLVLKAFADCDEVWHAGDFGAIEVADELEGLKAFRGVYGNIDDSPIRHRYPRDLRFEIGGVDVLMTHICGYPGRYNPRVREILDQAPPDVLVYGHSHILRVDTDEKRGGIIVVNPGAAGNYGDHLVRTLMKAEITNGEFSNLRVIELGPRGGKR
ncbi:MAG: metallophosphoesterase family protein [Planctomycetota bacterium]